MVSRGYAFQMEIIIRAKRYGYTLEEVTYIWNLGPNCICGKNIWWIEIGSIRILNLPEGIMEAIVDILIVFTNINIIKKISHYFLDLEMSQSTTYVMLLPVNALHITTAQAFYVM